ncbi:hypothetical protein RP726_17590 [Candidatus Methylospira mobilis]|uniref:TubC N-terminal docking domain-related protein n=1 Tax=Candidatus Methylospira mobilis TaxID=1808979 RepID=UPI0028ED896D|nr:hypothetical protein [Candidatus Methylospira mobilis]WNV04203.1 hypothetical protein RP726_17590 [Candidatus Methylospira mobilis]
MSAAIELLSECRNAGLILIADGDNLRCRGNKEVIGQYAPRIRQHKPEILAALTDRDPHLTVTRHARHLAESHGKPLDNVLALLDESDRQAIETGSDPGRIQAWAQAVSQLPFSLAGF